MRTLKQQADAIAGLQYEIIVADDGSRDQVTVIHNFLINELDNCRYIRRHENVGRAAIRNYLVSEATGEWLLLLDSDVSIVRDNFLEQYITHTDKPQLIDGGVTIVGDARMFRSNLRFWYEYTSQPKHTAGKRSETPYQHIHTANLMVPRKTMENHPFDERIRTYGYEDVLLGKQLQQSGTAILHIDNPVGLDKFESNKSFVAKAEESLRTLHTFSADLKGYSTLLDYADTLRRRNMLWAIRLWHKLFGSAERRQITGKHPSLRVFNMYKLGYYATL